nr:MAG TPA: hypothetical protein [Caudoviricetes sp.]
MCSALNQDHKKIREEYRNILFSLLAFKLLKSYILFY